MFKKFCLWVCTTVFTFSVLGLVTTGVLVNLVRPNHIKHWVDKSGAYGSLGGIIISDAAKQQAKDKAKNPDNAGSDTSFTDPLIQKAAKDALTADFFKTSVTSVVDGSFKWLDGQVKEPDFNIDISATKLKFVDQLGVYAKERYLALPKCTKGQGPKTDDLLTVDCQTKLVDIDAVITAQKQKLLGDDGFLAKDNISAKTIGGDKGGESPFTKNAQLPKIYKILKMLPMILGATTILSALGVIFLAETKRHGLRKLGWRLLIVGIIALILVGLSLFGLMQLDKLATHQKADAMINSYKNIFTSGIGAIRLDVIEFFGSAALLTTLLGGGLLFGTRSKDGKHNSEEPKDKTTAKAVEHDDEHHDLPVVSTKHKAPAKAPVPEAKPATEPKAAESKATPKPPRPTLVQ